MNANDRIIFSRKAAIDRKVKKAKVAVVVGGIVGILLGGVIADHYATQYIQLSKAVYVYQLENPVK